MAELLISPYKIDLKNIKEMQQIRKEYINDTFHHLDGNKKKKLFLATSKYELNNKTPTTYKSSPTMKVFEEM